MDKATVFLALPHYGQVERESDIAAFVRGAGNPTKNQLLVTIKPLSMSLLPLCFNNLWCEFENGDCDFFAMLHADVCPTDFWMDALYERMQQYSLSVLHAVVAIKDDHGRTSTAVGEVGLPFKQVRRVSTKELKRFPETFEYQDMPSSLREAGNCLLPNTGCMMVRREGFPFDEFAAQGGFSTPTAMWRDPETGRRMTTIEPEDWRFGRFCAMHGLRVGGTKGVKTTHIGAYGFRNWQEWGDEVDSDWLYHNPPPALSKSLASAPGRECVETRGIDGESISVGSKLVDCIYCGDVGAVLCTDTGVEVPCSRCSPEAKALRKLTPDNLDVLIDRLGSDDLVAGESEAD